MTEASSDSTFKELYQMYQVEEEKMKHKVIVAMSLVAAGVMTYLMFLGLDEGFYHFPWELFAGFGMMSWLIRECLKLVSDVKKEFEK